NLQLAPIEPFHPDRIAIETLYSLLAEQPRQFALHGIANLKPVAGCKAGQHQFLNVQLHFGGRRSHSGVSRAIAHTQPAVSVSVSGFSSFANSLRAAARRCDMRTRSEEHTSEL